MWAAWTSINGEGRGKGGWGEKGRWSLEGARAMWAIGEDGREKGIGRGEGKRAFRLTARPSLTTVNQDERRSRKIE